MISINFWWLILITDNTDRHQILSEIRLVVSRRFCCAEYKSGDQIAYHVRILRKLKLNVKKRDFGIYSLRDYG